jgi:hypothetical protein
MLTVLEWIKTDAVCEAAEAYHARQELSCSKLKDCIDSPEWFYLRHIAKTESGSSSSSMDFGTAIHEDLLLEAFIKGYKIIPPEVLAKNHAKSGNAWKEFKAANAGIILLKIEEAQALDAVTQAVLQHPVAMELLTNAPGDVSELSLLSDVQIPGNDHVWKIKSRLDKLKASGIVVDLKTIADMDMMKKRPYEHRWGLQSYLYRAAANCYLERDDIEVRFVVVETKAPRRVRVWAPSQETLCYAEELACKTLQDIAGRTLLNDWNAKDWLKIQEF